MTASQNDDLSRAEDVARDWGTVVRLLTEELETGSALDALRVTIRVAKARQGRADQEVRRLETAHTTRIRATAFPDDEHETCAGTPYPEGGV